MGSFTGTRTVKYLPWSEDHWTSERGSLLRWDKPEHFLIAALGTISPFLLSKINYLMFLSGHYYVAAFFTLIIGFFWERRNGKVPYGKTGKIEGFSWKDIIANMAGVLFALGLYWTGVL